jgi:hypothetical protein
MRLVCRELLKNGEKSMSDDLKIRISERLIQLPVLKNPKREMYDAVAEAIDTAIDRGHSIEAISNLIKAEGFDLSPSAIRQYRREAREALKAQEQPALAEGGKKGRRTKTKGQPSLSETPKTDENGDTNVPVSTVNGLSIEGDEPSALTGTSSLLREDL